MPLLQNRGFFGIIKRKKEGFGMIYFFAKFGFSMLGTAFISSFLNPYHSFILCTIILFCAGCFRFFSIKYKDLSAMLFAAALGFFVVALGLMLNYYPAAALDGMSAKITGTVTDVSATGGNPVFTVKTDSVSIDGAPQNIKIKLSGWGNNSAKPYDKISCTVSFISYGKNDAKNFFTDRSAGISVYAYTKDSLIVTGEDRSFPGYHIYLIREKISSVIYEYFIGWHAPFMEQLLIGKRGDLDYDIITAFRKSGMSHILAISGMHMVIVIKLFEKLLFYRKAKGVLKKSEIVILIIAVLIYMLVGGFGMSIRRAGGMLIAYYLAKLLLYGSHTLDNLGIAIISVLIFDSSAVCDGGFLMSVFTCCAISVFVPPLKKYIGGKIKITEENKILSFFTEAFSVSFVAFLAVLPISAIIFGEIYPISVVSNIFAALFSAPTILFGFATVLLGVLPFGGFFAGGTAAIGMIFGGMLYRIADFFAFEGDFMFSADSPWVILWILGSAVLIILPGLILKTFRYIPVCFAVSFFVLCGGLLINQLLFSGSVRVEVSALEHGTAIECYKDGSSVLIAHRLGESDRQVADIDGKYDAVISLDAVSGIAELEISDSRKTRIAVLSDADAVSRTENAIPASEGRVDFWENAHAKIVSSGIICIDLDEISVLYISEECDIMDMEPKFRKADIIILDGVSPADYDTLRCEYLILRDRTGYYSGAFEVITLMEGKTVFFGYDGNIKKGWAIR